MCFDVLRFAVRRESHHLVLTGVHSETGEVGEGRVEQPERMWKPQLVDDLELVTAANANRRRRPFANAIHRHDRRLLER